MPVPEISVFYAPFEKVGPKNYPFAAALASTAVSSLRESFRRRQ